MCNILTSDISLKTHNEVLIGLKFNCLINSAARMFTKNVKSLQFFILEIGIMVITSDFGPDNSSSNLLSPTKMVVVVQLVRIPDCGSGGHGFESHQSP